jgi:predicted ATPase/class 3 adenylate cyclase
MNALASDASAELPSGTITFVFSDIEGSTQRWDRDRAAMQDAVRRHDALMRAAIGSHNGRVFKTIGDAFCAAFSKPEDAVAAMFDAQRALAAEDFSAVDGLRVRAAIHTGTADERDNDYFGPAVNRVARLLGLAYGGQVLVSGVTSDIVAGSLPPQASLRDLGEHRLKDLSRPEYVYQLLGPGLLAEFPPLKSLGTLPNNLPPQLKSFVGRETEIAEITALISQHRIVTVVGSGGIGKTRASLHVAANLLDGSGDGVWLIELAPLSSGDYIPSTITQTMGLSLAGEGDPLENLVATLASKHALLVFDNCEHLVEPTARVIGALIRGCPNVHVLASSRQGLGLEGEITYRLPSLGVPAEVEASQLGLEEAKRYPAVMLFADRARASETRFELTAENAPIVGDICRRLDGIPLAIELAAARVKILSPGQLRDRLDERFRVLTGGSRDLLPRQQTLRALIDWSHDLLDERERRLFRRIGIFVNGFTLEAAVAVGGRDGLDEFEVMDVLASLVDKSLVLAEPSGDALRYRLIESTRAYAAQKLTEAGEREAMSGAHVRHFRDRFAALYADLERTRRPANILRAFETELDDLRAALDWAIAGPDLRVGAELLAAIERLWGQFELQREGVERVTKFAAALPESEPLLLAKLGAIASDQLTLLGKYELALDAALRGVAHARASGDRQTLAYALRWCAYAHTGLMNLPEAEAALREAEAIPGPSPRLRAGILDQRAELSVYAGDYDAAALAFEQLRDVDVALGNVRNVNIFTSYLADIEFRRGRVERAIEMWRDILPSVRSGGEPVFLSQVLALFAAALTATGEFAGATAAVHEAIAAMSVRHADHSHVAAAIETLALVLALEGDPHRAARLAAYADATFTRLGYRRTFADQAGVERLSALLREKLAPRELARLSAEGTALAPEAAIALALQGESG